MTFSQFIKKRSVKILLGLLVMFAVFVSLLPVGVKMYVEGWYKEQGVASVAIGDIDVNLFTGVVAIKGMQVKDESQEVFSLEKGAVDLALLKLFSRRIQVQSVSFQELKINIERSAEIPLKVAGLVIGGSQQEEQLVENTPENDAGPGWAFGIVESAIERLVVNYKDEKISTEVVLQNANFNNALAWTPDETAILAINGEVNGSPVSVTANIKPFSASPSFNGEIKIDGISVDKFAELAKPGVESVSGKLSLDSKIDLTYTVDKSVDLKTKGIYRLDDCNIVVPGYGVKTKSLKIEGAFDLNQPVGESGGNTVIRYYGDLKSDGLTATDRNSKLILAQIAKLALTNIDINELESIEVEKLELEQLQAIKKADGNADQVTKPVASVESIQVENTSLASFNDLSIDKVVIKKAISEISKDKDGKIALLDELGGKETRKISEPGDSSPDPQQDATEAAVENEGPEGFKFKVAMIEVIGDSQFIFKDASVIPKFESVVDIQSIALSNLDNSKPANESQFSLKAKLGKYSSLNASGKIALFEEVNDFSLVANIQKYDLPPLSSYTSRVLGYDLVSGQADINIKASRAGEKIDGEAKLKLNNLTVKETDPEHMKELNEQLSIPLSSALSLLRDKNDDIKLTIPVTGKLLDPDVGVGDVINTALGKALKGSTIAYLKYAFQPYGTVISIVQMAGNAAGSIQLDPVGFDVGESVLKESSSDYLVKIVDLLKKRESIRIKLCGVSTEQDRAALVELAKKAKNKKQDEEKTKASNVTVTNDDLFALAKQRAENIKDYLVNQYKVDSARLFVCHPQIGKEEAKPEVELLI